jgi:peptide-methionine (R)-S-oxide reductase
MGNKKLPLIPANAFQPAVIKSEDNWQAELSDEQYRVLRLKGTERPFTGRFDKHFQPGKYVCAGCGADLFISDSKFNSGCGWPSFDAPETDQNISYIADYTHGMSRIEIVCSNCGGHLGHVFDDGPTETGLRYCVNSASLDFRPAGD